MKTRACAPAERKKKRLYILGKRNNRCSESAEIVQTHLPGKINPPSLPSLPCPPLQLSDSQLQWPTARVVGENFSPQGGTDGQMDGWRDGRLWEGRTERRETGAAGPNLKTGTLEKRRKPTQTKGAAFEKMNMKQNIFLQWASAFPVIREEFLTCGSLWRQSCTFPEFAFSSPPLWMFSIRLLLARRPGFGCWWWVGGWVGGCVGGVFACFKSKQRWAR